ncbi:hypothetical protein QA612_20890 [Evansella sp. AB-P1]|uniref:hypothetical protein n=1 Tax=Evansella sp. AB-P1 TaxID=3037653 RepID=UPI00241FF87D|nr:hypothetical protein [Evansella sp. AB-P1]MDG5789917.1 hypothetical protein [Evansella sp. AB-P1]
MDIRIIFILILLFGIGVGIYASNQEKEKGWKIVKYWSIIALLFLVGFLIWWYT